MNSTLSKEQVEAIVRIIRAAFPQVEGVYLYGSAASGALDSMGKRSDVDVAVLLPHEQAKSTGSLALSDARFRLEQTLARPIDLVNARAASIVLQKEIIHGGICVFAADTPSIQQYEMLVLSLYGKLNEERREILHDFYETGRAYPV